MTANSDGGNAQYREALTALRITVNAEWDKKGKLAHNVVGLNDLFNHSHIVPVPRYLAEIAQFWVKVESLISALEGEKF